MSIRVESEIGRLRRVLVHRPGREIDWMVPSLMERLLFDDILDGEEAREEHDTFCRVLQAAGVETVDPARLLVEVLAKDAVRQAALDELEKDFGLEVEPRQYLEGLEPAQLAEVMVSGTRRDGATAVGKRRRLFELDPLPNYFFQRDPQIVLGDRVVFSAMATEAREREPFLARLAFENHPTLAGARSLFEMDKPPSWAAEHEMDYPYPNLEGGDVLVPSARVLLVGLSARTNVLGCELLARHLKEVGSPFEHMILVQLPAKRSYMHLDTVFTFIDHGLCLGYTPVVEPDRTESARVYLVDLRAQQLAFSPRPSLQQALAEVGLEVEIVPCGGSEDPIVQQREQWTDGANAFAIAPGVIALYRRNRGTVQELVERGWRVLREEEVLAGAQLLDRGPTVVTLYDNELSRARGGPRCMTMPLERDPLA